MTRKTKKYIVGKRKGKKPMTKNILTLVLAGMFALGIPSVSKANQAVEIIEKEFGSVSISIRDNTLYVVNANGQQLYIYNVAGVRVVSVKVEGMEYHYDLNLPKGCYIVKVGNTVRKISLK